MVQICSLEFYAIPFDFSGGTFNVSVVKLSNNFEVRAVCSNGIVVLAVLFLFIVPTAMQGSIIRRR
jgi:hypothetical protein